MLETKNVTIHAVGRASRAPQSRVRCGERRRRACCSGRATTSVATSAGLHFGPGRGAPLNGVVVEEPEDGGVLQVGHVDVAGGGGLWQGLAGAGGPPGRGGGGEGMGGFFFGFRGGGGG